MEPCPECGKALEPLLEDDLGAQYFRCTRGGFHWVRDPEGNWWRANEWARERSQREKLPSSREEAKELKTSPLRRTDLSQRKICACCERPYYGPHALCETCWQRASSGF